MYFETKASAFNLLFTSSRELAMEQPSGFRTSRSFRTLAAEVSEEPSGRVLDDFNFDGVPALEEDDQKPSSHRLDRGRSVPTRHSLSVLTDDQITHLVLRRRCRFL